MVERQRGDLIFVGSDVALRQRPHMGAYGAAKAALVAMVTNLQMELEGTGVRASIVHPGPTKTNMGWSLPAELIGPALEDWAKWGQARHDYFLRASDLARAIAFVAETPRGGFIANMELQPEAPLASAPKERQQLEARDEEETAVMTHSDRAAGSRGGEEEHGHLEEFRTDPIASDAARPGGMRRRRLVSAGRQARHLPVGRRGQRVLLPVRRRGSRPGRGLPVHDADLRARAWCSTPTPSARKEMLHNTGAAR